VVRGFDPPDTPYGSGHRGVDLAAPAGTAVLAAGPGVVVYADLLAGRGVVSIQHAGGLRTTYEPVAPTVAAGEPVEAGAVIGHLVAGHPGCARSACLHWGLRRGESYLDPLLLINRGPVRLLPRSAAAAATSGSIGTIGPATTGGPLGDAGRQPAGEAGRPPAARAGPAAAATLTVTLGWLALRRRPS
jgi:hypothetical protein